MYTILWSEYARMQDFVSNITSFNPSRDCKTLRATLVELLQKWLGAVPLRLRPTNNKHLLYRSQCNTDIFK
jgi:hypothetical protein